MATLANTTAIDAAVIARLAGDAALGALVPDGVHWDVAPSGALNFCIVSRADHDQSYAMPNHVMWERVLYLVKAVTFGPGRQAAGDAAFRIYELLQDFPIAPIGYAPVVLQSLKQDVDYLEIDEVTDARWQHCGAHYEIIVSPTT